MKIQLSVQVQSSVLQTVYCNLCHNTVLSKLTPAYLFFFALRLIQLFIKNTSAPAGDTPEKQIVILPLTKMRKNGRQFPREVAHMSLAEPLPLKSTANTSHPCVVSCPCSTGTGTLLIFLKVGNASTTQR